MSHGGSSRAGASQTKTAPRLTARSFIKTLSSEWSVRPAIKRSRVAAKQDATHASPSSRTAPTQALAEADLMADLMAGIDASVFDNIELSPTAKMPAVATIAPAVQASPTKRASQASVLASQEINVPCRPPAAGALRRASPAKVESKRAAFKVATALPAPAGEPIAAVSGPAPIAQSQRSLCDEDDFGFDFDFSALAHLSDEALLQAPPKFPIRHPPVPSAPDGYAATPWFRCTVEAVYQGIVFEDGVICEYDPTFMGDTTCNTAGKTLVVKIEPSKQRRVVHLKDSWANMHICQRDIVNIVSSHAATDASAPLAITFKDPKTFLIHHPDLLLTMTAIANAMPCLRRPLLQALVKVPGPATKAILYGNIQHTLLQAALTEQDFSAGKTLARIDGELEQESVKLDVWGAGLHGDEVRAELCDRAAQGFERFGDKWVGETPSGELHSGAGDSDSRLAIMGLHEVEEDIWSPKWGLKGKVDASVQARVRLPNHFGQAASGTNAGVAGYRPSEVEEHVAPLEIKTGRSVGVLAHRAQTMLYTLLMEDRYGVPVPAGLLYYSQLDQILRVEARQNEIRALVMARNELAGWLSRTRLARGKQPSPSKADRAPVATRAERDTALVDGNELDMEDAPFLPPTIDNARECKNCYAVDACMLYRKAVENVDMPNDPLAEVYEDKMGHMTDADGAFFRKWETLLSIEEQDLNRFRSQLWTMSAEQRQKTGRCFGDMVIASSTTDPGKTMAKINRYSYTFVRAPVPTRAAGSSAQHSLLSGHIGQGDPVSLSIEPDLLCLARGYVTGLSTTSATVTIQRPLHVGELLKRSRRGHRHRVIDADGDALPASGDSADPAAPDGKVVFRIDKDEMSAGFLRMRANLAALFLASGDSKRRRLIVHRDAPRFDAALALPSAALPAHLNGDQRAAMQAVLTAKDYALVLGMPGTGKTTTIAEIIRAIVSRGQTVLLTSYTHSAVDTILMKLLGADFAMLRLGNTEKVHPDVQHLTLEAIGESTSTEQLDQRLMNPPVVAATCLATDHPLFFRRKFDYCIVDEASQITLPTCLGPLRMAETFVLVGDHFQLPPIVKNPDARRGGLDVSLFRMLSEAHPAAVTDLAHQYRMNEDIMALSNRLIYENRLKCGSDAVAQQRLRLPGRQPCSAIWQGCACADERCWVQNLLNEDVKAVFVDTDGVPALDSRVGDLVQNEGEARLVCQVSFVLRMKYTHQLTWQLATALAASGVRQQDMAVITPYRQQIKLLSSSLDALPKIEILTADKSQGRDKDVVLISLVRSNETGNIGDLLRDWRRINVSFTRAKKKLVIFGSRRTLKSDPLLADFFALMESRAWMVTLPSGADQAHGCLAPAALGPADAASGADKRDRRGKVGERVLGRPVVKEIMETS